MQAVAKLDTWQHPARARIDLSAQPMGGGVVHHILVCFVAFVSMLISTPALATDNPVLSPTTPDESCQKMVPLVVARHGLADAASGGLLHLECSPARERKDGQTEINVSVFQRDSKAATMALDKKDGRVLSWTMTVPETYPRNKQLSRMLSHPKMDRRRVEGRFRAILHKLLMRWTKRESLGQWTTSFVWPEGDLTQTAPSAIVVMPHFAHGALVFGEHITFRVDLGSGKIIGYESTNLSQPTAPNSRVTEEQVEEKALKKVARLKSPGKQCCYEFDAAEAGLMGKDALVGLVPAAQVIRRVFIPLKRRQLVETYEVRGARICPTSSMEQLQTRPEKNPKGTRRVRFAIPTPGSKGCHGPVYTYYFRTDNGKLLATVAPNKKTSLKPLVHSKNRKQPDLPVETLEQMARTAFAGIAEKNGLHIRMTRTSIAKASRQSPTRKLTFQAYFRLAETPFLLPPE